MAPDYWRRVFLAAAIPVSIAWFTARVWAFGDRDVILGGRPVPSTGGFAAVTEAVWVVAWALAFCAGVVVSVSKWRGATVGLGGAYRRVLRRLPTVAALLISTVVVFVTVFLCAGATARSPGLAIMAISLIVAIGVLLAGWLALALAVVATEAGGFVRAIGRARRLAAGRRGWLLLVTIGVFIVGPLIAVGLTSALASVAAGAALNAVADATALVLLSVLIVAQASAFGRLYATAVPAAGDPAAPDVGTIAQDVAARVRARLRWSAALLPLVVGPLLVAGITAADPGRAPILGSSTPTRGQFPDYSLSVAAGGDAYLTGESDILRCDSVACDHAESTPIVFAGDVHTTVNGVATVAPDGTFIDLGTDGSGWAVTTCPATPPCTRNTVALPPSDLWNTEPLNVIVTGDGLVLAGIHQTGATTRTVTVVRCADRACARPQMVTGVPLPPDRTAKPQLASPMFIDRDQNYSPPRVAFGLDGQSRPVIAWTGGPDLVVTVLRCDDPVCRTHTTATLGLAVAAGTDPAGIEALAVDPRGNPALVVQTRAPTPAPGLHVRIGPADQDRVFVVRCVDVCRARQWHELGRDQAAWSFQLAFRPDGSPVLLEGRGDRIVWCERHCD